MPSPRRTRLLLAGILVASLALRVAFISVSSPVDDAYITFRYAENLAGGHGFVYNPGEHVLGTTSPLFALLLAPFALAGLPPDAVALALAVLFDLGVCLLLFVLFRRGYGDACGVAAAAMYGLCYAPAAACGYGMETQLFMLLVVAGFVFVAARRWESAAGMAGLAVVTRPEGFLLAAIVGVALLSSASQRARFARSLAVFVAVAGAWYFFAWLYFGSPIPNSVHAKLLQTGISTDQWAAFFIRRNAVIMMLWVLAMVGAVLGVRRRNDAAMLPAAWLVLYAAFFLAARPPFLGGWYFPPLVLALAPLAALASMAIATRILRTPERALAATLVAAAVLAVVVTPRSLASNRWNRHVAHAVFIPLATFVREHTTPESVVHASDVGYVGYFSGRRILDGGALVSNDVQDFHARHGRAAGWDIDLVLERRPDVVVLPVRGDVYRRFAQSAFAATYEPAARFQADGETDLHPPLDITDRYSADARFVADYIVYTRR
ncbi:MAG TPA: hypothetical protein VF247_02580 [Candidatus Krumholzibacteria bacterium]